MNENAAAQKYLDLCAKDGITPKFPQFLTRDSKGNYTAPSGYWKLLIDRKMVNHVTGQVIEQKAVQPKFDFQEMHRIMKEWVGDETRRQQQTAINRVLDDVKAGRIKVTAENTAETERLLDMPIIRSIEEGAKEARKQEKAKLSAREETFDTEGNRGTGINLQPRAMYSPRMNDVIDGYLENVDQEVLKLAIKAKKKTAGNYEKAFVGVVFDRTRKDLKQLTNMDFEGYKIYKWQRHVSRKKAPLG
jgi:hypothetical protein